MSAQSEEKVIQSLCNMHCGGQCILNVHVKDGFVTRIETDNGQEPQYRACLKGRAMRQVLYAPDRLKWPLKRVGKRGKGDFKRISWDEALDTVASEIQRVAKTYGPAANMFLFGTGDHGWLADEPRHAIPRLLCKLGGYTSRWCSPSFHAAQWASVATYGCDVTCNGRDDLVNSRLIIMWGWDPAQSTTETRSDWCMAKAKEAGARIVAVDPKYGNSAATFAHEWIPIVPGSDAAMLIAMAHVMFVEGLLDQRFLDTYTMGSDRFRDYVLGVEDGIAKTPTWAEPITGVPAATIARLAREFATTKPAALMAGIGAGRTAYGEQYHRAAITLAAMTGNIGISGGGPAGRTYQGVFSKKAAGPPNPFYLANPIDRMAPTRHEFLPGCSDTPSGTAVHYAKLGDALLKGKTGGYFGDYKLLYIFKANLLTQVLNANKIVRALEDPRLVEFVVTHEQFMTPTAKFADIVLPHTTIFEREDIYDLHADPLFIGFRNKIIEPLYECKSPFEIARELAKRLNIADEILELPEEEYLRRTLKKASTSIDYDTLKMRGSQKETGPGSSIIVFREQIEDPANHPFPTPSGKIEIYSQRLAEMGNPLIPPIPKYIRPWEGRDDPLMAKYPLQLLTSHCKRRAHNQFDNVPWLREAMPNQILLNPLDAEARGINDGYMVRAFNDRGEVRIAAKVTERIMPGVVEIPQGAWFDPHEQGVNMAANVNVLTKDDYSPCGAYPTNSCLVQVEKA